MASPSGSFSNGGKDATIGATEDEMERGEAWRFLKRHSEKDSGLSTPGAKKQSSLRKCTVNGHLDPPSGTPYLLLTKKPPETPLKSQVILLRYAVTHGDDERAADYIGQLEEKGMLESAGFTTQDAAGNGLLQIAALGGHSKIAAMLLDRGININSVDRNHGTALQAAIYMARTGPKGVIRLLLDWGKAKSPDGKARDRINVNMKGGYYGCALQVAAYRANSELVRELVNDCDPKADVNISGGKFGFPLQAAVRTGRRAVVEPILSVETDPVNVNAKGGKYGTALQAVARGKYRKRETLPEISRAQVLGQDVKNTLGKPIDLHNNAGEKDYHEVANMLFDKGAKMDGGSGMLDNPINAAASSGDPKMLKLMLDHFNNSDWGVDKDRVLSKALLTAITLSPEKQLKLVKSLVQSGASIQYEISGSLPSLPLEAAASKDLLHVVEYLLEAKDNQKQTVDLSAESGIHGTALRAAIAAESERVAQCLIIHQAKEFKIQQLSMTDSSNLSTKAPKNVPRNVQALAISSTQATVGSAISAPAGSNETLLAKDIENVRNRAELICRDAEYGNILQLATSRGLVSTVDLLLKYGADPNIQDTSDRRALHIASWFGFPGIVDLLLTYGAEINAKDEWGATARDQAEESLDRDGHPGGSEADLQRIRQTFANKLGEINREKPGTEFKGPKKIRTVKKSTMDAKSGRDEKGKEKPMSEETKVVSREVGIGATETTRTPAENLSTVVKLASTGTAPRSTEVKPENAVKVFSKAVGSQKAKPVFTMPSWIPGLGFKATIIDIWESEAKTDYGETEVQECLLLKEPNVDEILYHKAIIDAIMKCDAKPTGAKEKVRWIHLPTNNMTWAEMLITSLCNEKNMPVYKSFWGTDPFYTSPDLSPHSRFITPQCGRLIQDGLKPEDLSKKAKKLAPLFMAMPYIHWETDLAQTHVAEWIEEVRLDSEKTSGAQENNFWPSEKNRLEPNPTIDLAEPQTTTSNAEEVNIETQDAKENYLELLRRYLFKRRPVHLRRTLDQYYYSHLADTNFRDSDQVVMRQLNEEKKDLKLQSNQDYQKLKNIEEQEQEIAESSFFSRIVQKAWRSRPMRLEEVKNQLFKIEQTLYRDNNSPVLMVDQLWLWVVDEKTVVTCFPRRLQSTRDNEDLDGEDKTDILKTIVTYLHSPRRPEIENSNDLTQLIFCQCVSILHRADMIPEVDFLKNYSIRSNIWADEVMQMLIQFVKSFENFMVWIKQQPAESEESIRRFEEIFNVTKQTHLLRNIQDIKDELCMLEAVFQDQMDVLGAAGKEIDKANFQCIDGCEVDEAVRRCPHSSMAFVDQSKKHWMQITRMQAQANQAYDTLKDLLNLKQQQANVLEARVSRNEAISSGEQSKTIMVFTIVTIVFLPLTFVTTIFTLPIAEFKRVVLPADQSMPPTPFLPKSFVEPIIIGVTFAVAIPLIIAAFKIQWAMNTYKLFKLWVSEELKKRREEKRKTKKEHYWPDFLTDNEKVEQDSELS